MKNGASLWLRATVSAIVASAVGFAVHVADQTFVPPWVALKMQGVPSAGPPTLGVIIAAALSSIEIGGGYCLLYFLVRGATPNLNVISRGLAVGCLGLAIRGDLLRQPIMNTIIGNPLEVALAMAAGPWLTSILMSVALAVVYEWLVSPNRHLKETKLRRAGG
jgi:hypothetical protein